jgi:hypothetical protein
MPTIPNPSATQGLRGRRMDLEILTLLRSLADDMAALKAAVDALIDAPDATARQKVAKPTLETTQEPA